MLNNKISLKNEVSKNLILGDINIQKKYGNSEKVVLFANARDEKHIREWAAHHLLLGFDKIIIYDHKSKIPLKEVFKNFDKRVLIIDASLYENPVKIILMNYSVTLAMKIKADWMIYLDADEFLIFNDKNMNIKNFLDNYKHAHSLAINWLMFGSNYLVNDPDGLIIDNYTKSEFMLNPHVKSFVRPNEIINSNNPHFYHIKKKIHMYDILSRRIKEPYSKNIMNFNFNQITAYIAHYVTQCEESFIQRKCRPTDDTGGIKNTIDNDIKNLHNQHNNFINYHPKNTYSDKIKNFLAKYNHNY
jgi:hypothetical protein